jgi:triphosphoribosyl-dephospho-CoA synthase
MTAARGDDVFSLNGLYAQLACIWEATARKPGNVHRYADFEDTGYLDFLTSAAALGPVLAVADEHPLGDTIFEGVRLTRHVVANNTNLGILLLLAPLAAVAWTVPLQTGLEQVLAGLTEHDAVLTYQAIHMAAPAGLGRVADQDVRDRPTQTLRQVMARAADRDLVARQYANGFHDVFVEGVPALQRGLAETQSLEGGIIHCHLHWMAHYPDSLIARKRGQAEAAEAAVRAQRVLEARWPHHPDGWTALAELEQWLRAEGHTRNPGTTADLVAACLFVALRQAIITLPPSLPWSCG